MWLTPAPMSRLIPRRARRGDAGSTGARRGHVDRATVGEPRAQTSAAPAPGHDPATNRSTWLESRWLLPALLALAALLWLNAVRQSPQPIDNIDAEEYAAIGRALATSAGFTTPVMPLNGLAYLHERGFDLAAPWPNITRFPAPSLTMAALFTLFGATPFAAALSSGLFYVLATLPLFALARAMSGAAFGLAVTLLYLVHPAMLAAATSGLTESASACLIVTAFWLAYRHRNRPNAPPWLPLALGATLGLAFWNRQTLVALAAPLTVWLVWPRQAAPTSRRSAQSAASPAATPASRTKVAGLVVAGLGLLVAPWLVRNIWVLGDPFINLQTATVLPFGVKSAPRDFPWYLPEYTSPAAFITTYPNEVFAKWLGQLWDLREVAPSAFGPWFIFGLALISLVMPSRSIDAASAERRREFNRFRLALFGGLAVQATVYSFVGNIERFYSIFQPLVAILAVDGLRSLAARARAPLPPGWRGASWFGLGATCLIVAVGWTPVAGSFGAPAPREISSISGQLNAIVDISIENQPYIRANTPPGALFATNLPWSVGWQGQRRATPLSPTPDTLATMAARFGLRYDYIYLNPQVFIVAAPEGWKTWDRIRDGRDPPPTGFVIERRFGDGSMLLRRDRDR